MEEERRQAAIAAAQQLTKHALFMQSKHIACYVAYRDEFATQPLMEAIWQAGKICYLPVLAEGRILHFARYDAGDELVENQYSILEPKSTSRRIVAEKLDLVISPLIAFDKQGNRLGTGGGFYDRTFAFMYDTKATKPILLGLGFSAQQAEALPCDPWDIKLHGVITEISVLGFHTSIVI